MSFSATDCIFIMGTRGCGKSFLAKRLQNVWPRRVIIDPTLEYTDDHGKPIFPDAILVHDFQEFGQKLINLEKSKKFILIYQVEIFNIDEFEFEFNEICKILFNFGNIQIVLEEVQEFASTSKIVPWLRRLLLIGRHRGISLLFTSQRPGAINKNILSQCIHIFCGSIIEGNDLRYISSFLNQDAKLLNSLPIREFIWRSPNGVKKIRNDFEA